jgi:CheY-like chemotaxis protein
VDGKAIKIVLLDNNFEERSVLKKLLKLFTAGKPTVKVYTSDNGVEGLGYVFLAKPDILIINSKLPQYGGVELINYLNNNTEKLQDLTTLSTVILHDQPHLDNISDSFLVFNKKDNDFLQKFLTFIRINVSRLRSEEIEDIHEIETGEHPSKFAKFYTDLLFKLGFSIINWSQRGNKFAEIASRSWLFKKLFFYVLWIISQIIISIEFTSFNIITGKEDKDENVEQEREDAVSFRVRYYPTLITFISGFLFIVIQLSAFFIGGSALFLQNSKEANAMTINDGGTTTYTTNQSFTDGLIITNNSTVIIDSAVIVDVSGGSIQVDPGSTLQLSNTAALNASNGINIYGTMTTGVNSMITINGGNFYLHSNNDPTSALLTAQRGTHFKFGPGLAMFVGNSPSSKGKIVTTGFSAPGSANNVFFESASGTTAGSWLGIFIDYPDPTSSLFRTVLRYGGSSSYGVLNLRQGSTTSMSDLYFDSNYNGVFLHDSSTNGNHTLTSSVFVNSTNLHVIKAPSQDLTFTGNSFSGTGLNAIGITGHMSASGTLRKIDTLETTNLPYVMQSFVNVNSGVTLDIDAGVVIKGFSNNSYFQSQSGGTINVNGTNSEHVKFTSIRDDTIAGDTNGDGAGTTPNLGDYTYILSSNGGTANINADYTDFYYFGNSGLDTYAFNLTSSSGSCSNCHFENGYTSIILGPNISPTLNNISFVNIAGYPIQMGVDTNPTLSGTYTFTNSKKVIALRGTQSATTATIHNVNWPSGSQVQYFIDGNGILIGGGKTLTIEAGNIIKGWSTGYITTQNGSTLILDGNSSDHITFTSYRDDGTLEDIWNDGATTGSNGDWKLMINSDAGGISTTNYTDFKYFGGGCGFNNCYAIYLQSSSSTISNSTFTDGAYGINIFGSVSPTISNISFVNLTADPISQVPQANPSLTGTFTFTNSKKYVAIRGNAANGTLFTKTWGSGAKVQYFLEEQVTIPNGVTLQINEGNVFKGGFGNFNVQNGGTLNIIGLNADPVTFTSYRDDGVVGDIWNDGDVTGVRGDIRYTIQNQVGGTLNMDYVNFKFFGDNSGQYEDRFALISQSSNTTISNTTFTTGSSAMAFLGSINPTLSDITFNSVTHTPILINPNTNPTLSGSFTFNNSTKFIGITGTANSGELAKRVWGTSGTQVQYLVVGTVTIPNGVTYEIREGNIIKGKSNIVSNYFYVQAGGVLESLGTSPGNLITFASTDDDNAGGMTEDIMNNGVTTGSSGDWNIVIQTAGSGIASIGFTDFTSFGTQTVFNNRAAVILTSSGSACVSCRFTRGETAISLQGAISPTLTDLSFDDIRAAPLYMEPNANPTLGGNYSFNNSKKFIAISGTAASGSLAQKTWGVTGNVAQYYFVGDINIPNGVTYDVEAGTIFKSDHNFSFALAVYGFIVNGGTLNLNGSAEDRIAFTSFLDDGIGEDVYNDVTTVPSATGGDWGGIRMNSGTLNADYTLFKYADGGDRAALWINNSSNPTINLDHVIFQNNRRAILNNSGATPSITFANVDLKSNSQCSGGNTAFDNFNSSFIIDAETVYWGGNAGPIDNSNTDGITNPTGNGVCVSDYIDYGGFSTGPFSESAPPPTVNDGLGADIDGTSSTNTLSANWTSTGVNGYDYAIGTSAGGTDIIDWTFIGNVTTYTKTGLSLDFGITYYFSVRANDSVLGISTSTSSDGIVVDQTTPNPPTTLRQFRSNDSYEIGEGGMNDTTSTIFKASVSDSDGAGSMSFEIEIVSQEGSYTGTPTYSYPFSYLGGTQAVSTTAQTGLTANTKYKWRARVKDEAGNTSSWVNYGGNVGLFDLKTTIPSKFLLRMHGQNFNNGVGISGTATGQSATIEPNQDSTVYIVDSENYLTDWVTSNITLSSTDSSATFSPSSSFTITTNGQASFRPTFNTSNISTGWTVTAHQDSGSFTVADGISSATLVSGTQTSAANSTVETNFSSRIANNSELATITITLKDGLGNPVGGKVVTISSTGGGNTVVQPSSPTDSSGQTTATIKSSLAEIKTISATDATNAVSITQTRNVTFTAGPVSASVSTLSANPLIVVADNTATSVVTITTRDQFGNPVSGKSITISSTGSGNTIVQPSSTTNINGMTTATIRSNIVENKVITALNTTDGITITQTASIDFVVFDLIINESSGSSAVTEGGAGDTFTLVLTGAPTNNVNIDLSHNNQISLDKDQIIFTSSNWDQPQTVSINAINDGIVEGNHSSSISFSISSSDPHYTGLTAPDIDVDIIDNDAIGIQVIEQAGGVNIAEASGIGFYNVKLKSQPSSNVNISISFNSAQISLAPTNLVFTNSNWDTNQAVLITAINDDISEGNHISLITHTVSSSDNDYDELSMQSVNVHITDDDTVGVIITSTGEGTNVVEGGASDTYNIVLKSQPLSNVTINITPSSQVTVDKPSIIFTSSNWNTPQVITVSAVNDTVNEDTHSTIIGHSATSSDPAYNGIPLANLTVTIDDNDFGSPGIIITSNGGLEVNENGSGDYFSVKLATPPVNTVTLTLNTTSNITTNPTVLTFTTQNWNINQVVNVTAVNDNVFNSVAGGEIHFVLSGSDPIYNASNPSFQNIVRAVQIDDDDEFGVILSQSQGSTTLSQSKKTDTYTLRLNSQPTDDVVINIVFDSQYLNLSTNTVIFTSSNWNINQTIQVNLNDNAADLQGNTSVIIDHLITTNDDWYSHYRINDYVTAQIEGNQPVTEPTNNPTITPTEEPVRSGEMTIRIIDNDGNPVAGAVIILEDGTVVTSDENGYVTFKGIDSGDYTAKITYGGKTLEKVITINEENNNNESTDLKVNIDQPSNFTEAIQQIITEQVGAFGAFSVSLYFILFLAALLPMLKYLLLGGFLMPFLRAIFSPAIKFGAILDDTSYEPIAFAGITVFDRNMRIISKVMTNVSGHYHLKLNRGDYTLKISRWDYQTKEITVHIEDDSVQLDDRFNLSKTENSDLASQIQFRTVKIDFIRIIPIILTFLLIINAVSVQSIVSYSLLALSGAIIIIQHTSKRRKFK